LLDHGIPGEVLEKISKLTACLKASNLTIMMTSRRRYKNSSLFREHQLDLSDDDEDEVKVKMKTKKLVRNLVPGLVQGPTSIAPCAATSAGAECRLFQTHYNTTRH